MAITMTIVIRVGMVRAGRILVDMIRMDMIRVEKRRGNMIWWFGIGKWSDF